MGLFFSIAFNKLVVDYLKSLLEDGNDVYTIDEYQTEFNLNKLPGNDNAPKCHTFVKNSSIQCQDLNFESQPFSMKSTKVTVEIGEAVVRCDDLGYIIRITGRIIFFDVFITASFASTSENVLQVSDIDSKATMNKIKSEIELLVNGTDHSRLLNALLSIDDPDRAGILINAAFMLQRDILKDFLNENIKVMANQYGF